MAQRKVDETSGLAYTEEVYSSPAANTKWVWRTKSSKPKFQRYTSDGAGPRSLRQMAIRAVCVHSEGLESTHLEQIPWSIAKEIWYLIKRECGESSLYSS